MQTIELSRLHADPKNPNICTRETMDKIKRNIERTGECPPLIVRPHPSMPENFIIIDGHHRKLILEELGWPDVECQVWWHISEKEAAIALSTLNRLHGTDNLRLRAELIETLMETIALPDLALILPESETELSELLSLLQFEEEALERAVREETEKEQQSTPVPLTFMLLPADIEIVEKALERHQDSETADRSQAFLSLCKISLEVAIYGR